MNSDDPVTSGTSCPQEGGDNKGRRARTRRARTASTPTVAASTAADAEYVVAVPSYKRAKICAEKTLATLRRLGVPSRRIYVYVANADEKKEYEEVVPPDLFAKLVVGKKGLVAQRDFIERSWPRGKPIVFMDDDIADIDLSMSALFREHTLDFFFRHAFAECRRQDAFIWGVYAVFNPFFRKGRPEIHTGLTYVVGALYGVLNRPGDPALRIDPAHDQKEDVERTLRYFKKDGTVVRFDRVGFKTKYYGREGGLGTFEARLKPMRQASRRLARDYPGMGRVMTRKNGMTEFVLARLPKRPRGSEAT